MKTVYAVVMTPNAAGHGFMPARLVQGTTDGVDVTYRRVAGLAASTRIVPLARHLTEEGGIDWFETPADAVADYAKKRQQFVAAHNAHVAEQVDSLNRQLAELERGVE